MAGSRRRLKKNAPKVKVAIVKRKKDERSRLPAEVAFKSPAIAKKLKTDTKWDEHDTLNENYAANGLVADPNRLLGRKEKATPLVPSEVRKAAGEETFSDDDEQRAAMGLPRKAGRGPPARPTATQRRVIGALLDKHGDDVHAMVLDTKLNKMQLPAGELRKLIEGFRFWGPECSAAQKHDFWTEKKPPKRLLNCRIQG